MSIGRPRLGLLLATALAASSNQVFAHFVPQDRRYRILPTQPEPPDHARREEKALRARLKAEAKRDRRAAKRLKEQGR